MMLHDQLADSPLALPSSIYAPSQTGKPPNYHTHLTQWFGAKPATRIFQNSNRTYKGNINRKKLLLLWSLNQLLLYSGQCWCFMPITLFNHHNSLWIKTICRKEQVPGLPGRWCVCVCLSPSCVWLFASPWTVSHQAPLSMEFSRQKYWSGVPLPFPGDLPNPGIKPQSLALQRDSLPSESTGRWRDPNLIPGDGGSCGVP